MAVRQQLEPIQKTVKTLEITKSMKMDGTKEEETVTQSITQSNAYTLEVKDYS